MKRYIYSSKTKKVDIDTSMFKGTPFQCYTGMSYYDDFLSQKELEYKQRAKNRTGEIVMMSPEDYYYACSQYGFNKYVSVNNLKRQRSANGKNIEKYEDMMRKGKKFCLCVLNKADRSQEGLHRMMAAGNVFGWDTPFPVLVVTPYDTELEEKNKEITLANNYREGEFQRYCRWSAIGLSDWYSPVPDNFEQLYREAIISKIKDSLEFKVGDITDIDVEVEVDDNNGNPKARAYLTKYNDYAFPTLTDPYVVELSEMYDVNGEHENTKSFDDDSNDIDISDLFIR